METALKCRTPYETFPPVPLSSVQPPDSSGGCRLFRFPRTRGVRADSIHIELYIASH